MEVIPKKGTMVEGISDEIVESIICFVFLSIPLVMYLATRRPDNAIHPENQQRVDDTRQQLEVQREGSTPNENEAGNNGAADGLANTSHRRRQRTDSACPICLQEAEYPIETNCGHLFCANCFVLYWQHGNWVIGPILCPVCRQRVTILLRMFTMEERAIPEEVRPSLNRVNEYNRRFSGEPRPWIDYVRDLPTLLRHLIAEFFSVGGLVWMFRLRIVLCLVVALLYFISPLDIIPEGVFGFLGLFDDLFIIVLLLIYVTIIYRHVVTGRGQNGIHVVADRGSNDN